MYKVEPYLHRCVDSILAQTFTDFELILVDDGSPDGCPAICDEYAKKDSRVHVIHQKNGGLSAARNAGIDWAFANSDSQWISFVDSDDWVHPEYLDRLMNAAIAHSMRLVVCGYAETCGEDPQIEASSLLPEEWIVDDFYVQKNVNATIACGKLYRKELFENIRYPVGKLHEDEFITYKCLFACKTIIFIPAPLYSYYQNADGITKSGWNPRRLDGLDALAMRIPFFLKAKNYKLYKWSIDFYIWHIVVAHRKVHSLSDKAIAKKYSRILMNRLRCALFKHRKHCTIKKFSGVYEMAYPRFMKLYWITIAICNRITTKLVRK